MSMIQPRPHTDVSSSNSSVSLGISMGSLGVLRQIEHDKKCYDATAQAGEWIGNWFSSLPNRVASYFYSKLPSLPGAAAAPVDAVEEARKQIEALESRLPEINSQLDAVERLRDAKMATVKEKLDALQNRVQKISVRISEGWGGQHNEDCAEEINEGEISPLLTEAEALQTQSESLAEEAAGVKAKIEDLRADYLDGGERPVYD